MGLRMIIDGFVADHGGPLGGLNFLIFLFLATGETGFCRRKVPGGCPGGGCPARAAV